MLVYYHHQSLAKKLYMRVRPKPTPKVWYSDQSYGINNVASTVKDLCNAIDLKEKFTNHSLRATCTSRMYARSNNVSEQMIKEVTGHRNDCVRVYKRTNDEVRPHASSAMNGQNDEGKNKIVNVVRSNIPYAIHRLPLVLYGVTVKNIPTREIILPVYFRVRKSVKNISGVCFCIRQYVMGNTYNML